VTSATPLFLSDSLLETSLCVGEDRGSDTLVLSQKQWLGTSPVRTHRISHLTDSVLA
jgi:hypothetical protein